jgi:uncharacterized protein
MALDGFHLVLMVTHRCNLRCDYCYMGRSRPQSLDPRFGRAAIHRAIRSLRPGGTLELGFFGGEPLLEAGLVATLLDYALHAAQAVGVTLKPGLTTNGTQRDGLAWQVMGRTELDLCISHDGLPDVHDRHRRRADGTSTSAEVLETIRRLRAAGRPVRTVTVVRPDSLERLPEGITWLRAAGVRRFDLTLDVWTVWQAADMPRLAQALARLADLWLAGLPENSINWFDEKAARLARLPIEPTARCGFGNGEVAVAPSGRLYPCERLIGEDRGDHPLRLPGHVLDGADFLASPAIGLSTCAACAACAVQPQCNTYCRCNNYLRTGDPTRPDALLCFLDQVCLRETARVLRGLAQGRPVARPNEERTHGQRERSTASASPPLSAAP